MSQRISKSVTLFTPLPFSEHLLVFVLETTKYCANSTTPNINMCGTVLNDAEFLKGTRVRMAIRKSTAAFGINCLDLNHGLAAISRTAC
jgi:hypothetical protein